MGRHIQDSVIQSVKTKRFVLFLWGKQGKSPAQRGRWLYTFQQRLQAVPLLRRRSQVHQVAGVGKVYVHFLLAFSLCIKGGRTQDNMLLGRIFPWAFHASSPCDGHAAFQTRSKISHDPTWGCSCLYFFYPKKVMGIFN